MNSESIAGILGAIVAVVVLVAAFVYGPIGQSGKPAPKPTAAQQPTAPVQPAAPAPRGPVIREVPN
jgi:cell division protein FtsN